MDTQNDGLEQVYHLESRWRNSHVLVYHGSLLSHLLGVTPSTFTMVQLPLKIAIFGIYVRFLGCTCSEISYSFFQQSWFSGKWPLWRLNSYSRDPLSTSMIMGGKVCYREIKHLILNQLVGWCFILMPKKSLRICL